MPTQRKQNISFYNGKWKQNGSFSKSSTVYVFGQELVTSPVPEGSATMAECITKVWQDGINKINKNIYLLKK